MNLPNDNQILENYWKIVNIKVFLPQDMKRTEKAWSMPWPE